MAQARQVALPIIITALKNAWMMIVKMSKKIKWFGKEALIVYAVIGLFIYSGGLGNFANEFINNKSVYVGEPITITYYCDVADGCNLATGYVIDFWVLPPNTNVCQLVLSKTLEHSSVGNYAVLTYTPSQAGQHIIYSAPHGGFSSTCGGSAYITTYFTANAKPAPPAPQCTASYVCKDATVFAYKNADCSYSQVTNCPNGCENNQCRLTPSVPSTGGGSGSSGGTTPPVVTTPPQNPSIGCSQGNIATPAINPQTGVCISYATPCDVPVGWSKVTDCSSSSGTGASVNQPVDKCAGYQGIDNIQCAMGGQNNFFLFIVLVIIIIGGAVVLKGKGKKRGRR